MSLLQFISVSLQYSEAYPSFQLNNKLYSFDQNFLDLNSIKVKSFFSLTNIDYYLFNCSIQFELELQDHYYPLILF